VPPTTAQQANDVRKATIDGYLHSLTNPTEQVRLDAVSQLGRLKARRAVDPLAATLAGDKSPAVREAAAKALGLIGSPSAMPALNRAIQADSSHDVRRTAQFSLEIIQAK
jgi:HEAT repeat protein